MTSFIDSERKTRPLTASLAWIVPQTGEFEGKVFPLHDQVTVGSSIDAGVTLREIGIAAIHVSFHLVQDSWYVKDAGSGMETSVLDRRLSEREKLLLNDDDTITLGPTIMVFKRL